MSEFEIQPPEMLREAIRESENIVEEEWRENKLAKFLFHDEHLDRSISDSFEQNLQLFQLQQDFLEDKRGLNMGQRFDLAISPKYLGKVHVVELGHTTDPGLNGEIDGLKAQYYHFVQWLNDHGIIAEEMSRQESKRNISVRKPVLPEAEVSHAIIVRNRPLINTEMNHNEQTVSIGIVKRMVFSAPRQSLKPLLAMNDSLNHEYVQQAIEERFLTNEMGNVIPIRTTYYLATDILS